MQLVCCLSCIDSRIVCSGVCIHEVLCVHVHVLSTVYRMMILFMYEACMSSMCFVCVSSVVQYVCQVGSLRARLALRVAGW